MARIFHRPQAPQPDHARRPPVHLFGFTGLALAVLGWGLLLYVYTDAHHQRSGLRSLATVVVLAGAAASIGGIVQRSWAGWVGFALAVLPAVVLFLLFLGVLLIWLLVSSSGAPGV